MAVSSAQSFANYAPTQSLVNAWSNSAIANQNYLGKLIKADAKNQERMLDYATQAQASADAFNREQAAAQRLWTTYMSDTAHQREVADLKAAGLNPVLSANAGAPVGNGASASSSNALTGVFGNMANTALAAINNLSQTMATNSAGMFQNLTNNQTQRYAAMLSAKTNLSINEAQMQMNKYIAELNSLTSQEVARISGEYGVSKQAVANLASNYSADLAYAASVYSSDKSAYISTLNNIRDNNTDIKINNSNVELGVLQSIIGAISGAMPNINYGISRSSSTVKKI